MELGTTKRGREIGKKPEGVLFIWSACLDCRKERWVQALSNGKPRSPYCPKCSNKLTRNPNWGGGRRNDGNGYVYIRLLDDDFFKPMSNHDGYVFEHRYIMAQKMGRCLQEWELVHHKNGIKNDNRIENLELTASNSEHIKYHTKGYRDGYLKGLNDGRNKQIEELRKEIKFLHWQINQIGEVVKSK
jgi:hypothetical protein